MVQGARARKKPARPRARKKPARPRVRRAPARPRVRETPARAHASPPAQTQTSAQWLRARIGGAASATTLFLLKFIWRQKHLLFFVASAIAAQRLLTVGVIQNLVSRIPVIGGALAALIKFMTNTIDRTPGGFVTGSSSGALESDGDVKYYCDQMMHLIARKTELYTKICNAPVKTLHEYLIKKTDDLGALTLLYVRFKELLKSQGVQGVDDKFLWRDLDNILYQMLYNFHIPKDAVREFAARMRDFNIAGAARALEIYSKSPSNATDR